MQEGTEVRIRWYTPEEAAKILQLGRTRLYEYLRAGRIKALKFGRLWRIPASELDPATLLGRQAAQTENQGRA